MRERNQSVDVCKGIAIVLMVIGHSGCPLWLSNFIYSFHMPLFFFFSGYFFTPPPSYKIYLIRKVNNLYIPYLKWSLTFLALHNMLCKLNIYGCLDIENRSFQMYTLMDFINRFFYIVCSMEKHEPLLGGFWFIKVLFLGSLLYVLFMMLFERINLQERKFYIFVIFLVLAITSKFFDVHFPVIGNVGILCMGVVFITIGSIYKGIEFKSVYGWGFSVSLLFIMVVLLRLFPVCTLFTDYIHVIYCLFVSVIGIMFTFSISCNIRGRLQNILSYIGAHTLVILSLHFLAFKIVSLCYIEFKGLPISYLASFPVIKDQNPFLWIMYSIVGVILPLLMGMCSICFKKNN